MAQVITSVDSGFARPGRSQYTKKAIGIWGFPQSWVYPHDWMVQKVENPWGWWLGSYDLGNHRFRAPLVHLPLSSFRPFSGGHCTSRVRSMCCPRFCQAPQETCNDYMGKTWSYTTSKRLVQRRSMESKGIFYCTNIQSDLNLIHINICIHMWDCDKLHVQVSEDMPTCWALTTMFSIGLEPVKTFDASFQL